MSPQEGPPAGPRGRIGASAEAAAAAYLTALGWLVVARNVRVGRDELDLVAWTPAPERQSVVVEVRARSGDAFGSGLESVDARKVARLYRAVGALRRGGHPALGPGPLTHAVRIDLLVLRRVSSGAWTVEVHLRGLEPPA